MEEVMHAEAAHAATKNIFTQVERDGDGRAIVTFTIQSAPVSEVGVNGIQAQGMLEYVKELFVSLNSVFPCRENSLTITKIEEAIHWQEARTRDREKRNVEGKNQA